MNEEILRSIYEVVYLQHPAIEAEKRFIDALSKIDNDVDNSAVAAAASECEFYNFVAGFKAGLSLFLNSK